jgi:hypothetical protein
MRVALTIARRDRQPAHGVVAYLRHGSLATSQNNLVYPERWKCYQSAHNANPIKQYLEYNTVPEVALNLFYNPVQPLRYEVHHGFPATTFSGISEII